jgi:acetoin utilization deacetylase AcuC-like enzyme
MPFVWSDDTLRHQPRHEVVAGHEVPATESPQRAMVIRGALLAAGHPELAVQGHPDDALTAVHQPGLLQWLREASREAGRYPVGRDRVVPDVFPTPMMTAGMPWRYPAAVPAQAGVWCYDTMTHVGPRTWDAARAAVDVALTATELVITGAARHAYALCRPPGHHATPAGYGGSCYLNNAAIAAQRLASLGVRVAVVDLDAHHGNGTQAVFWQRPDVLYTSVHVDPGAGWFPHVQGFADEIGADAGTGTTRNLPLPPGSGDAEWLAAVNRLAEEVTRFRADALVVSLGLDAAADEPGGPLRVSRAGFGQAGLVLAGLGLPTVVVQEGGRHLPTLGRLVHGVLAGFATWNV